MNRSWAEAALIGFYPLFKTRAARLPISRAFRSTALRFSSEKTPGYLPTRFSTLLLLPATSYLFYGK